LAQNVSVSSGLLANRPFRRLLIGHGVSSLGDWVATFGLMLFVRNLTSGSSVQGLAISGILGFRILPALIAAPVASSVTDRFDRRRTMIAMDLLRGGLICIVPFAPRLGAAYAIAFFLEGLSLVFLPARDSIVPNIVRPSELAGANGMIMLAQWGTIPFAGALVVASDATARLIRHVPIIGLLARQRLALPFFFDALTFVVSAIAILGLPASIGKVARSAKPSDETKLHAVETDLMTGVRYLLEDRGRRNMIIGMALATGAGGGLFAIGIPYVKTTLHASDSIFGALVALWGVGMALGALITQRPSSREADIFRVALGGSGIVLILMAVIPHPWLALVVSIAFGAGLSIAMVMGITYAQRTAPEEMRGRVMSAVHVLARVFLILGGVVVGGIAAAMARVHIPLLPHWDGYRYAFLVSGAALVVGGLAAKAGAIEIEADAEADRKEVSS